MSPAEIRLKLIELARPDLTNPDIAIWIGKAAELEAWVLASTDKETPPATEGQASPPPQKRGPVRPRKSGEPEYQGPAFND